MRKPTKHSVSNLCLLGWVLSAVATCVLLAAPQQTAHRFYRAIDLMETKGDYPAAIEVFKELSTVEDRDLAAKSTFYLGLCYEKLGKNEAKKEYQKIIDSYSDQIEVVKMAKERMALLSQDSEQALIRPSFRKIRIPTELSWDMRFSPDGERLSLISEEKIWIMLISGKLGPDFPGPPVKLDTENVRVEWSGHTWSQDGKWIAFNEILLKDEWNAEGRQSIYVVPSEGGKPKKVRTNYRDVRVVNYKISLSPDGKTLAYTEISDKEQHIFTVPIEGGTPKQLVDALAREPVFSPDGEQIAYVEDKNLGQGGGGVWVVSAEGGSPNLVAKAGMATSPTWSPDGDQIAYLDFENNRSVFIVPINQDGDVAGEIRAIETPESIQALRLLSGWTPDNKIGVLSTNRQEFGIYSLPFESGKATLISHGGYPLQPRWSPDGKSIFHVRGVNKGNESWQERALAVVPADGGEASILPLKSKIRLLVPGWGAGNRISPDGATIVFAGKESKTSGLHMSIWTLGIDGTGLRQITNTPEEYTDMFPCCSPDGNQIAFVRFRVLERYGKHPENTGIFIVSKNGGEPIPLAGETDLVKPCPIAWSPNGRLIAYYAGEIEAKGKGTLNVIPVGGGESRVIGDVEGIGVNKELAWSPDSGRIAFNDSEGKVIKLITLEDGSIEDISTGLVDTQIYHLDWSPDGSKLVFSGWTGGEREFWVMENFLPPDKQK